MKKIYISGPLTGVENIESLKSFYQQVGHLCSNLGAEPYIPHLVSDPILNPDLSSRNVYDLDHRNVVAADLVIAYVGVPSLGVGQEIEIARQNKIPIILIYEENKKVSRMARGNPSVILELSGPNFKALLAKLSLALPNLFVCRVVPNRMTQQAGEHRMEAHNEIF